MMKKQSAQMVVVTYAVALAAVAVAADHLFDEIHILHHTHYHNARSIGSTRTNTTLSHSHTLSCYRSQVRTPR